MCDLKGYSWRNRATIDPAQAIPFLLRLPRAPLAR
jgi:hypothetical protein